MTTKPPRDLDIFIGSTQSAAGVFIAYVGISGFLALTAIGTAGFAPALSGLGYLATAAIGIFTFGKGAIRMGKGFTDSGKTPAEVLFEQDPQNETFQLRPLTQEFDLEAKRPVKVMRPLKINKPQPSSHPAP